jgi:hypothetical protein
MGNYLHSNGLSWVSGQKKKGNSSPKPPEIAIHTRAQHRVLRLNHLKLPQRGMLHQIEHGYHEGNQIFVADHNRICYGLAWFSKNFGHGRSPTAAENPWQHGGLQAVIGAIFSFRNPIMNP